MLSPLKTRQLTTIVEETAESNVQIYRLPNISRCTIEQLLDNLQQKIDDPYTDHPVVRIVIDARKTPVTTPYTLGWRRLVSRSNSRSLQAAILVAGNANSFLLDTLIESIQRVGPTAIFTNEGEALEWLNKDTKRAS